MLKNIFPENNLQSLYLIAFVFLGIFPLVPFVVKPFLLLPITAISFYNVCFIKKVDDFVDWRKFTFSTCLYLVFLLSVFYTTNIDRAFTLLIRLTPFLVLPFSFAFIPKDIYEKLADTFIYVYIFSCGLFCLVICVYCISLRSNDLYYIYSYLSNEFWGYEDHPIYLSLYFGIALILTLFYLKKSILKVILFIVLFSTLLFLARKGNLLGLVIVMFFMMILNYKRFFNKQVIRYSLVGLLIVVSVSYFSNNTLFVRFKEIVNLGEFLNNPNSSTGIRSILWNMSIDLSLKSPFIGYGLGSVQDLINSSLIDNGYQELTLVLKYNSHNQYLQMVLISGYIGLLVFLCLLSYIYFNIKHNISALCVFVYIVFCFMFESLLERQNGIIISALFFNLFLFLPQKKIALNE